MFLISRGIRFEPMFVAGNAGTTRSLARSLRSDDCGRKPQELRDLSRDRCVTVIVDGHFVL